MGIKITELPSTPVNDADYIPVANTQSGTRKVLMSDIIARAQVSEGAGLPAGGTTGQILAKASSLDYDVAWITDPGGGGTTDYDDLTDKPSINGVTLSGNKTGEQLGLDEIFVAVYGSTTAAEIEAAYQAGKTIICQYGTTVLSNYTHVNANNHRFLGLYRAGGTISITRNASAWSEAFLDIPTTAAAVGAIAAPSSPTAGQFLVYDGSAWVAQTVPSASGVTF